MKKFAIPILGILLLGVIATGMAVQLPGKGKMPATQQRERPRFGLVDFVIIGRGVVVSEDKEELHVIKIVMAKFEDRVENKTRYLGLIKIGNIVYRLRNVTKEEGKASGIIVTKGPNGTEVGSIDLNVIEHFEGLRTFAYGTLELEAKTFDVYILGVTPRR